MFLHADLEHLFFNMFALFIFGNALERRVGGGMFLLIYFVSGIVGAAGFMLVSGPGASALGASGAIFGVIGALIVVAPKMVVYLFGAVPMPMAAVGLIYAAIELFGFGRADNIAHSAHLLGLVGGFALAKIYEKDEEGRMPLPSAKSAAAFSLVFGLLVALVFGFVNYGDGIYVETQRCTYSADEYENVACFEGLVEKYGGTDALNAVCDEYLGTYLYVKAEGFEKCGGIANGSG